MLAALREARAEVVTHFAAHALVGESMQNPGKYFGNNVGAGLKLLDAVVAAGVKKFVFSSTCATYGPPETVPITVFGVAEEADLIKRYRDAGVARIIFNLPAAESDEVLPVLDRCAALRH